jgi:hypothetical protein
VVDGHDVRALRSRWTAPSAPAGPWSSTSPR